MEGLNPQSVIFSYHMCMDMDVFFPLGLIWGQLKMMTLQSLLTLVKKVTKTNKEGISPQRKHRQH